MIIAHNRVFLILWVFKLSNAFFSGKEYKGVYVRLTGIGKLSEVTIDEEPVELKNNSMDPYISDEYKWWHSPEVIAVKVENSQFLSTFLMADIIEDGLVTDVSDDTHWRCTTDQQNGRSWTWARVWGKKWPCPMIIRANDESSPSQVANMSSEANWVTPQLGAAVMYCRYTRNTRIHVCFISKSFTVLLFSLLTPIFTKQ